jgi:hypothetical protein
MPVSMSMGEPDGIFGSETSDTVKSFQTERHLKTDGVVGRSTLHELDQCSAYEDLRPMRRAVEEIGAAVENLERVPRQNTFRDTSLVGTLWSRIASMRASLSQYEPTAPAPSPHRWDTITRPRITSLQRKDIIKGGGTLASPNPIAAIALLLMAILALWRPANIGSGGGTNLGRSKRHIGYRHLALPFHLLAPVVTAWELLTFAEAVTRLTAEEVWRQIKFNDGYVRMRDCMNKNPASSPECAEAWRTFEKIRNQLLQKLNEIKSGRPGMYPNLVKSANDLYLGTKDSIGYLKALAAVSKCFNCAG